MHRIAALLLVLAAALAWGAPARASGDFGCAAKWKSKLTEMTDCDSRALLGPANDTRVNLVLLMRDRRHAALPARSARRSTGGQFNWSTFTGFLTAPGGVDASYADGEGSRCRSNDEGALAFVAALKVARGVSEAERASLIAARQALKPDCAGAVVAPPPAVRSTAAQPWAVYLAAAGAFYAGDFDAAGARFATLAKAGDPWLRETAHYMIARVELNRAQVGGFDEYGATQFANLDTAALARAEAGLNAYAQAYPHGLYTASARGLLRRVWWLGGRTDKLAAAYAALMARDPATRGIDDVELAQEIDNKLLTPLYSLGDVDKARATMAGINEPLLLAVADLRLMRAGDKGIGPEWLTAQRPAFAREPALYGFLQAALAYYVENRPAIVLPLIPDDARAHDPGPLQLSRQYLRGLALEAVGDRNARGFWLQLLPNAPAPLQRSPVELSIALHDERAGALAGLFAPGSPLTDPSFREQLLGTVAGPDLLRRQARAGATPHERATALYVLLWKELTRGDYRAFDSDLASVPADAPTERTFTVAGDPDQLPFGLFTRTKELGDYDCPPLPRTAAMLAADPRRSKARLCLAEFVRVNGYDQTELDAQPPADELGGTPSLFPGKPYSRLAAYQALIGEKATPGPDRAYALYRAVMCYAPSGTNECGGDVPVAQRKAWLTRLKKEYPSSRWAQDLDYYW